MSEFLAEARVVVRPDTTRFRAELEASLAVATKKPIVIPVVAAPTGLASTAASTTALSSAQKQAVVTTERLGVTSEATAIALRKEALAAQESGAAAAKAVGPHLALAGSQSQVRKGALATALSLGGARGATLAASSSFLIGAASATALFKSLSLASQVEKQLATFRVTAGATGDEIERVSEKARQLGSDIRLPAVSAADAVDAMVELAKAGLSVTDSLAAAEGVLQLATAAEISNSKATEITANALNAFSLNGTEAVHVADLLANASIQAQGSIEDMGLALRQAAAVARQVGLSVDETVTLLTILARAGLSASDAGTSLRVALTRLVAPTKAAQEQIQALGLELRDAQGNLRVDVFAQIGTALEGIGKQQQAQILFRIFGTDAQRVASILARQGVPALNDTADALERVGAASDIAGAKVEGLGGKAEGTKNQFEQLGLTIGEIASPAAGAGLDAVNLSLQGINSVLEQAVTSFSALGQFQDDANQLAEALKGISDDSGFTQFIEDTASGASLLAGDIKRASDAADDFTGGLLGIGKSAPETTAKIIGLSKAEILLAESMRDANLGAAEQIQRLNEISSAATGGGAQGLNVQQVLNRVAGFDEAGTKAKIRDSTDGLLAALNAEQDFLEQQLERNFVQRRPELRRQLEQNLLGVNTEIAAIARQGQADTRKAAAEAKSVAADAAQAVRDADTALLDALGQRTDDAQRKVSAAAETAGVRDDIRRQDALQALIKIQIAKVRNQVKDEKTRKDAIRELRIALISSRQEEDALRKQRAQDVAAAKQTSIELDITFAETTGNAGREISARQRLIALLKKQQAHVKKGTNEWKRLRNEIAAQQAAIKDAKKQNEEAAKEGNSFAQQSFAFLQKLHGFDANLLGNLIPGGMTGGLVGGGSGTATEGLKGAGQFGQDIRTESALSSARDRGVRPIQVDTTNQILRAILRGINGLNGRASHPETRNQRATSGAAADIL